MRQVLIALFLIVCSVDVAHSNCYSRFDYAANGAADDITINLSEDLIKGVKESVEKEFVTRFRNVSFDCSGPSKFQYNSPLSEGSAVIGLNNGLHGIRIDYVEQESAGKELSYGTHTGSEMNLRMRLRFTLVSPPSNSVPRDSQVIGPVMIVTDVTDGGTWWVVKVVRWAWSGFRYWPLDAQDMFTQSLTITYSPKKTTCTFDNAGQAVSLPYLGVSQVKSGVRPGFTYFPLNFSCEQLSAGGVSDRGIDMFLSSNNLSASSNTVLHDSSSGSASGVGIQLVKAEMPDRPVVISRSSTVRGNATSLFRVARGEALKDRFTIKMGAYYHVVDKNKVSAGEINTSAMLNIVYD